MEPNTIGRYRIIDRLGVGGFGVVYEAFDPKIQRSVAVKTMRTEVFANLSKGDKKTFLARFQTEVKNAGTLSHPNIIPIYDFGEDQGVPFFVMEYIRGRSLEEIVKTWLPIRLEDSLSFVIQIADGLDHAHGKGIYHRDIKPANVIVDDAGVAHIADFGISKNVAFEMTSAGEYLGTPKYSSPEQLLGEEIDGRTDIFSLGVVFYEMIVGRTPFDANTISAVIMKVQECKPALPSSLSSEELPPQVDEITAKALAKEPDDRYRTAREMAVSLRTILGERLKGEEEKGPRGEETLDYRSSFDTLNQTLRKPLTTDPCWAVHESTRRRSMKRTALICSAGLIAVAALFVAFLFFPRSPSDELPSTEETTLTQGPGAPSIAILPFRSATGNNAEEAFALGITEDLITDLSNIRDVRVAPLLAVLPFGDESSDMNLIVEQLKVRFVLSGSVRRAGSRVRITVQLVDMNTKEHVWAERIDNDMQLDEFFAIQDGITRRIVRALKIRLTSQEDRKIDKKPTVDVVAFDHYTRGRQAYLAKTRDDNRRAIEMYQKAIEADPGYALAYAGLSNCYQHLYDRGWDPDYKWVEQAVELAEKAVEIDPDLPEAHHAKALAMVAVSEYGAAIEADRRAISLRSNYFDAYHTMGFSLFRLRRYSEAREAFKKCLELYPSHYQAIRDIGRSHECQEAYGKAVPYFEKAYALRPICFNMIYLGRIYAKAGRTAEGRALLEGAVEQYPDEFWAYDFLGRFHMREMSFARAEPLYEQVLAMAPKKPAALNNAAHFYALSGNLERAHMLLEKSMEIVPDHLSTRIGLCSYHVSQGDMESAVALSDQIVARHPRELRVLYLRAQLKLLGGHLDEAEALATEILSAFPEDPVSHDLGGRILVLRGAVSEAADVGHRMIEIFPESRRGYNLLAASLFRQGRADEAATMQAKAVGPASDCPEVIVNAVMVFEATGRTDEASTFRKRLPGFPWKEIVPRAPLGDPENNLFWLKKGVRLIP